MYYVIRNNKKFGPYDGETLATKVSQGVVLKCDKACNATDEEHDGKTTVGDFLKREGRKVAIRSNETIKEQISSIGTDIIFPREDLTRKAWQEDTKLIILAGVGVMPALLDLFSWGDISTFYAISLYFSAIWGLFFFYLFKTKQVTVPTSLTVFFMTQAFVFLAWDVLGLVRLNPFYSLENSHTFVGRVMFFVCGVGLTEEFAKALPLILIIKKAREPLVPQTMVFYGLMSGIAFGVFEGVQYQISVNATYSYSESFLLNIARLTSLPFIHATWAAIAGYFVSFALLYPAYRKSLLTLAIAVPAVLHGSYDIACNYGGLFGWSIRIGLMLFSVLLLMTYLRRGKVLQTRLSNLLH